MKTFKGTKDSWVTRERTASRKACFEISESMAFRVPEPEPATHAIDVVMAGRGQQKEASGRPVLAVGMRSTACMHHLVKHIQRHP